tara:strand:+ start:537 stop:716 length:180 start_codon:yes stop_codon:yes gene_type:complete
MKKDRKELSLSYLDGHIQMSKKSVNSLPKLVTWELRSSHLKILFCPMSGHNKESLTHGG